MESPRHYRNIVVALRGDYIMANYTWWLELRVRSRLILVRRCRDKVCKLCARRETRGKARDDRVFSGTTERKKRTFGAAAALEEGRRVKRSGMHILATERERERETWRRTRAIKYALRLRCTSGQLLSVDG